VGAGKIAVDLFRRHLVVANSPDAVIKIGYGLAKSA
jgi:hypothetical protein